MGHQIAGNGAAYPTTFQIPDDGDSKDAATVNVAFEALADRTENLRLALPYLESVSVTATGSVVVPAGATHCFYEGCGGGGGGGGGAASAGALRLENGGGGGGGAVRRCGIFAVTPGETLTVEIGAGGAGGAGSTAQGSYAIPSPGSNGFDGQPTKIRRGVVDVVVCLGASNGRGGFGQNQIQNATPINPEFAGTQPIYVFSSGGTPVAGGLHGAGATFSLFDAFARCPSEGAAGVSKNLATLLGLYTGRYSPEGFIGGTSGVSGADAASYIGGGPGGGGGGGPYGVGGGGGNGGNANNAGAGANGANGAAAGANTGAGGGGGGAAGACNTGTGTGGTGGAGGSGRMTLTFLRKA